MTEIRVLVVDDSAVVRRVVGDIIKDAVGLTLVGTAVDGAEALLKIEELQPDVMTLDVEMPNMTGLEVLAALRSKRSQLPIIMLSSLTSKGSGATLEALSLGASDYVAKPTTTAKSNGQRTDLRAELVPRVFALAARNAARRRRAEQPRQSRSVPRPRSIGASSLAKQAPVAPIQQTPAVLPRPTTAEHSAKPTATPARRPATARAERRSSQQPPIRTRDRAARKERAVAAVADRAARAKRSEGEPRNGSSNRTVSQSPQRRGPLLAPRAVVIGSSTGGPAALEKVFGGIREPLNVPIFIVQHIPAEFSKMLASRLDAASGMRVVEAKDGDIAEPGTAYLAPGGKHMILQKEKPHVYVKLTKTEPVNSCRPAVDVLFKSAAEIYSGNQLAVILTGMGQDGLDGCRTLAPLGVPILAQDEETCVVWGMPRFVTEQGLADEVLPLDQVSSRIISRVTGRGVNTGMMRANRR